MVNIDSVSWGKIKIGGKEYDQVLIVGDKVFPRDRVRLEVAFGTSHKIGDWEKKMLFSENPGAILIANGWNGALETEDDFKKEAAGKGVELQTVLTSKIVEEYNRLIEKPTRVNCLIHTTC